MMRIIISIIVIIMMMCIVKNYYDVYLNVIIIMLTFVSTNLI